MISSRTFHQAKGARINEAKPTLYAAITKGGASASLANIAPVETAKTPLISAKEGLKGGLSFSFTITSFRRKLDRFLLAQAQSNSKTEYLNPKQIRIF